MAYTDNQVYAKYLKTKKTESGCSSCGESEDKCGCCPPGLVNVFDDNGNPQGCVTPNDAQELFTNTIKCPDGYIKVMNGSTFLGCLTPDEFVTYNNEANP